VIAEPLVRLNNIVIAEPLGRLNIVIAEPLLRLNIVIAEPLGKLWLLEQIVVLCNAWQ
jgi:hypothetical protein